MTRRLLPLVLILGVLAAACGEQTHAQVDFGSGNTFTTFVADAQDNVGQMPSVAVSADGLPYVASFGFPQELAEGEVPAPRPIDAAPLPAVLLTSVDDQGIWGRGAVAIEMNVPNSQVPFGPAEVEAVRSMEPGNVAGTAVAVDANGGIHVTWASDTGIWYGHNADGSSFEVAPVFELDRKLSVAGPLGAPSIAVDQGGTPWIAFAHARGGDVEVVAATPHDGGWSLAEVDTVPGGAGAGRQPDRTGVAVADGGPVVVYGDGDGLSAATSDGRGWSSSTVASGADGAGLSVASGADGSVIASYYAGTDVRVATTSGGTSWRSTSVATVGAGDTEAEAGRSTGVGVDRNGTAYVTWYDPGSDDVRLASGTGDAFEEIDVSGTHGGSQPALGVAPDGSSTYVAWYDAENQNLMLGAYGEAGGLAVAVPSPTVVPGGEPSAPPTGGECTTAQDGVVTITAQALAFDTSCIEVTAGEPFTIAFDNQDAGVQHNVAIYPSADELTDPIMKGDVITGVDQIEYQVDPLEEGEYYFHCDIHPTMNGTVRVVGAGGGGGGGGVGGGGGTGGAGQATTTVTASGLAFDTDTITLPAGDATTLTFDNQDAGVQHNISIYPSADEISPDAALFQGEIVTGPDQIAYEIPALEPGEYYFHCDVHPNMNGTVVVG